MIDETRGSIVNPTLQGRRRKTRGGKGGETRESLSRGYVRDAPRVVLPWDFPPRAVSHPLVRDSPWPFCSARYPLIDNPRHEMRYRGNDTYVSGGRATDESARRASSFRSMDHTRMLLRFSRTHLVRARRRARRIFHVSESTLGVASLSPVNVGWGMKRRASRRIGTRELIIEGVCRRLKVINQ